MLGMELMNRTSGKVTDRKRPLTIDDLADAMRVPRRSRTVHQLVAVQREIDKLERRRKQLLSKLAGNR